MSFFGFDPAANPQSRRDDAFFDGKHESFEDKYDGLAEDLDQEYDTVNDETFGNIPDTVGKDFDFSGQTALVRPELQEEERIYHKKTRPQQSSQAAPKAYQSATPANAAPQVFAIPELKPMTSLWDSDIPPPQAAPAKRQPLSLEEVEAQIMARQKAAAAVAAATASAPMPPPPPNMYPSHPYAQQYAYDSQYPLPPPPPPGVGYPPMPHYPGYSAYPPPPPPRMAPPQHMEDQRRYMHMPEPQVQPLPLPLPLPQPQPQPQPQVDVQPALVEREPEAELSAGVDSLRLEETPEQSVAIEREMEDEINTVRLSRYNGLMTSSDKNHITRLQLQQLVTEDPLTEDFYYQVYTALHGQRDSQSSADIAEMYLNEYGRRSRYGLRRQQESMQRLQQRAVALAKAHPKHEQLMVEGALGKIAFATVKAPRRILDVGRER
ncbi:topoisomerase II-associated protein PAT1, partial [Limtongia smithiae]|uniref:topoisomerase II-associated protein PAT1 n=1 Tax=Limtongia smithiae TaxID=1125753 RepID=UPI0034CFDB8F